MKRSHIVSLIILLSLTLAFGCSKNEPESGNDSGNGGETVVTGKAEPGDENAAVPTAEVKPTEESNPDLDSDKKSNADSSTAGQESLANDSKDSGKSSGTDKEESDPANNGEGSDKTGSESGNAGKNTGISNDGSEAGDTGTELPEATVTPEPIATGGEEPTGTPGPTDFPDPIDIDYLQDEILEKQYTDFTGTDEAAAKVAEAFANAYLFGYNDILIETVACDEDLKSILADDLDQRRGYSRFFESYMDTGNINPADIDMDGLLSLRISGGAVIDKREVMDYLDYYDTYVNDLSEWDDYQVFSAAFEGLYARAISDYEHEGINVIVAKKNGEYKVLTVDFYEIEETEIDIEDIKALIAANRYTLKGDEKADDIADLYKEAFEAYDFFKMYSIMAMDEEYEAEAFIDNEYLYYTFELCKHIKPGIISTSVIRSEAMPVTEAELSDVLFSYTWMDGSNEITDVVKYDFQVIMTEGNDEFVDTYPLYVGKLNGVYRAIDGQIFE